jgi:proteic killer suppression protein
VINVVVLSSAARKDLKKCPVHIVRKLFAWVGSVQTVGLDETRKTPGLHDEPLKGQGAGHRSIRLSKAYRAIYTIRDDSTVEFALVKTINKHDY